MFIERIENNLVEKKKKKKKKMNKSEFFICQHGMNLGTCIKMSGLTIIVFPFINLAFS